MNGLNEKRKIVCVLYDDPVEGYPPKYARDSIPTLTAYPDGQSLPSPSAIDFFPGDLLGCVLRQVLSIFSLATSSVVSQGSLGCEAFWKIVVTRSW